jgi:hypothetical protein
MPAPSDVRRRLRLPTDVGERRGEGGGGGKRIEKKGAHSQADGGIRGRVKATRRLKAEENESKLDAPKTGGR